MSTYFKYPQEVRRLIYTTNAIEGFNRQLRKVTKAKAVFPTDDSLLKMLYFAMMDITRKWMGRNGMVCSINICCYRMLFPYSRVLLCNDTPYTLTIVLLCNDSFSIVTEFSGNP